MSNQQIEQTITIDAPRERVFRALTDANELTKWFPTTAKADARTGGSYDFAWKFAQADHDHAISGTYTEVVPNETVGYTWAAGMAKLPTQVTFKLAGDGAQTKLTLVHSGWTAGADESREEHAMGWTGFLGNLKSWLERGVDERGAKMGMKTLATA